MRKTLLTNGSCMQYLARSSMAITLLLSLLGAMAVISFPHSAPAAEQSSQCSKNIESAAPKPGEAIVTSVFAAINSVLDRIGQTMYNGIINNATYRNVINAVTILYVALYGFMIFLNLASYRLAEITSRLIRIGILYMLISNVPLPLVGSIGWGNFSLYIGQLFLGGMNQLINNFANAANGLPFVVNPLWGSSAVDKNTVAVLFGPMNVVFSPFFMIAIFSMLFAGSTGWIAAGGLMYGFVQFGLMALGALITYVRAVVGLTFLFGVAPIFLAFLLFHKTRNIFLGWLNMMVGFTLAPVMLFAFLTFYSLLITSVLDSLFKGVDFCWTRFFSMPGTPVDVGMWRPAVFEDGNWVLKSGDWTNADGSPKALALKGINVLFFVLLCSLGKNFCNYINDIASTLSGGISAGVSTPDQLGSALKGMIPSGKKGGGGGGGGSKPPPASGNAGGGEQQRAAQVANR